MLLALLCMLFGLTASACGGPTVTSTRTVCGGHWTHAGLPEGDWRRALVFEVDLDGARVAGRIPEGRSDEEVLRESLEVVQQRLLTAEIATFGLSARPPRRFEVGFGTLTEADEKSVVELVSRRGTLEFAIEILPDSMYQAVRNTGDPEPARLGLWSGSADEYKEFKAAEWERWKKMQGEPGGYIPSRKDMRLVPMPERDGTHVDHFRLIEHKPRDERIDGRIVKDAIASSGQDGRPVVVFDVRKNYQRMLATYTRSNIGLPLAILLDEQFHAAPRIHAELSTNVQISMGTKSGSTLKQEAKDLATVLQSRSLPFVPKLVKAEDR